MDAVESQPGEAPGGTKYRKAQQLETPMIDEARLLEMLGNEQRNGVTGASAQLTLPSE